MTEAPLTPEERRKLVEKPLPFWSRMHIYRPAYNHAGVFTNRPSGFFSAASGPRANGDYDYQYDADNHFDRY